ncbi:sensor domain-containing diguanylate cyclase [Chitinimonas taiwanensis]|uniref:diguanylate cyclase n=1 Tax=Chitinimonas taiwanensis DSM 18899 TaxID=1121279 RepID=A0A1K2HBY4_9NEIS|nr:sensor domain-containing diguanylate cyclase [Chitinimonas taiwanensis]SFZ74324.1 diguanylate cyclase (GGDEF) domain-containing protein [Chitinimonas taiwanensis DSM 18899]
MLDWLSQYFVGAGMLPEGYEIAWSAELVWLFVLANTLTGIAYFSIPLALVTITKIRGDLRFNRLVLMFAAFILTCGSIFFLDTLAIWHPIYWVDVWLRVFSALLSLFTAIMLWRLIPSIVAIPSPSQLGEANLKLSEEIAARKDKEAALEAREEELRELSANLERKVAERTTELEEANRRLQREMSERQQMQNELQISNRKLEEALRQQAVRSNEMDQLNKMGDLMQSCVSVQELSQVLANFSAGYLEAQSGGIYLIEDEGGLAALETGWGALPEAERIFPPNNCWALRRGQQHPADRMQQNLRCQHVSDDSEHVCVPLIGSGETLGLLHLRKLRGQHDPAFLDGVAKRAALALVSLKAREALFNEAIHDPLTGLYNRRYLDGALEEAERRSRRSNRSVGVMMLDIDHFKSVNDRYGHDVGDEVLREFAKQLRSVLRSGDVACRYGGEEFTVLLTGASLAATRLRGEQFRQSVEKMQILQRGQQIRLTTSIGIAAFPQHGDHLEDVLRNADTALYQAKHAGRNRLVACGGGGNLIAVSEEE